MKAGRKWLICMVAASIACTSASAPASTAKVLVSGAFSFLDSTGNHQPIGTSVVGFHVSALVAAYHCKMGISDVVQELAETRTRCANLNFEFETLDTQLAANLLMKSYVANMNASYIIGALKSSSTIPLSLVAGAMGTPVMSYLSTSTELSNRDAYSLFSRVIPPDDQTAEVIVRLAKQYGLENVGILYVDDSFGNSYRETFLASCSAYNITAHPKSYRHEEPSGAREAIRYFDKKGLNVIVLVTFATGFSEAMEEAIERKMNTAGKLFIMTQANSDSDILDFARRSPVHKAFLESQQRVIMSGEDPTNLVFKRFESFWNGVASKKDQALLNFIQDNLPYGASFRLPDPYSPSVKVNITEEFFAKTWAATKSYGVFAFDAVATACRAICLAHEKLGSVNGSAIQSMLESDFVSYVGPSGSVNIDPKTGSRTPNGVNYVLTSVAVEDDTGEPYFEEIGSLQRGSWQLNSTITFPGGTSSFPVDTNVPDHDYNETSEHVKIFGYVMLALIESGCLFFGPWFMVNRKSTFLVHTQPRFLAIFVVGVSISTLAIIPSVTDLLDGYTPSQLSFFCNFAFWLWSCGNTITYAALITKQYRVWRIFDNPSLEKRKIGDGFLYSVILLLLAINLFLLGLWYAMDPLKYKREIIAMDGFGNVKESSGSCTSSSSGIAFLAVILCYNFILLAVATYVAFKVRLVDHKFQESQQIFMTVFGTLQVYIIAGLMFVAIDLTDGNTRALLIVVLVGVTNAGSLCFISLPHVIKFYTTRSLHEQSSRNSTREQSSRALSEHALARHTSNSSPITAI